MVSNLKKKRGKEGNAVLYATRNQALQRLQLRLPEFRRLCILKGVHPREPRKKVSGQNKTYYHVKDIAFLAHEPLLLKFREARAHSRKVRRAKAKGQSEAAARLVAAAPSYRLDSLVRERYPSLGDALRDLADPLTLLHLFAVLPAERQRGIPVERVHAARRCAASASRRPAAAPPASRRAPPARAQPQPGIPGLRGAHWHAAQGVCVREGHLLRGAAAAAAARAASRLLARRACAARRCTGWCRTR